MKKKGNRKNDVEIHTKKYWKKIHLKISLYRHLLHQLIEYYNYLIFFNEELFHIDESLEVIYF